MSSCLIGMLNLAVEQGKASLRRVEIELDEADEMVKFCSTCLAEIGVYILC
jgi:hypothetical protein